MRSTVFRYIDKGAEDVLVLIPGWATDYRIFNLLELPFNYLVPIDFSPASFQQGLIGELRFHRLTKVSMLGWSLGGFLASDFAVEYPELIKKIILISIRDKYKKDGIDQVKGYLRKNKRGYLYKFYTSCFSGNDDISWFKKNLLKEYCGIFNLDYLLDTLDYLANARIDTEKLKNIEDIEFFHGECDQIAPIAEAMEVKSRLPGAKFTRIKDAGHMPFLVT